MLLSTPMLALTQAWNLLDPRRRVYIHNKFSLSTLSRLFGFIMQEAQFWNKIKCTLYNDAVHIIVNIVRHYNDVIMSAIASQITSLTIVYLRRRSQKTSKFRVTGLREGNSPVTGEFPTQRASNAENVSILLTSSWDLTVELYPQSECMPRGW